MKAFSLFLVFFITGGCAVFGGHAPEGSNVENEHWLRRIVVHTIQSRRPEGTPLDPKAYAWEAGYRSSPLPNTQFNCEPLSNLTLGIDLARIRGCLKSIRSGTSVVYKLERGARPELLLEGIPEPSPSPSVSPTPDTQREEPAVPLCLVKLLPRIPIPREIVYQSAEEGAIRCYSSRIEDSTGLGADLLEAFSTNRVAVRVSFPAVPSPQNDVQTAQWLLSLALAPFIREQGLLGRLLVDTQCRACLGDKAFVQPWESVPMTWPNGDVPEMELLE